MSKAYQLIPSWYYILYVAFTVYLPDLPPLVLKETQQTKLVNIYISLK